MIVNKLGGKGEEYPVYAFEPVFFLDGAMYVPHYTKPHEWVTYGGGTKTTIELMTLGAEPEIQHLWARTWTEGEIFKNRERYCSSSELKDMMLNQNISAEPPAKKGKKK